LPSVRVTKYGHACLLVEVDQARLLIDPGSFSAGFLELRDLSAVLVTHQHPDHIDRDRLDELLEKNPGAELLADQQTAEQLDAAGVPAQPVNPGDDLRVAGARVQVVGGQHAVIHADVPRISNVGYLIGDRLLIPAMP
jgi:L-ascorbate metabolism protein UlaG (beta-lactamase superfamily)